MKDFIIKTILEYREIPYIWHCLKVPLDQTTQRIALFPGSFFSIKRCVYLNRILLILLFDFQSFLNMLETCTRLCNQRMLIRIISSVIKRHASLQFHWAAASLCPSVIFHFFIKHFPDMPEKCLLFRKEAWNNFSLAYYIASRRSTPPQWQKVNYFIQIAARNHYIGADWFDKYWPYEKKQYITRQRFIMKRDRWN